MFVKIGCLYKYLSSLPLKSCQTWYQYSRKKLMKQSKEIKVNWREPKTFDICFCVNFSFYDQSRISEAFNQIRIFPDISWHPKILTLKSFGNLLHIHYGSYTKVILLKTSTSLLVTNQTYKTLHCFIILFPRLYEWSVFTWNFYFNFYVQLHSAWIEYLLTIIENIEK